MKTEYEIRKRIEYLESRIAKCEKEKKTVDIWFFRCQRNTLEWVIKK